MSETRAGASGSDGAIGTGTLAAARQWLDTHERIALATVVATWGSSPVPVGGQMAIAGEDRFAGSVSGGCVESDVIIAAGEVIERGRPQLLTFGVSDETAWRSGLPCGGTIRVLVVRLERGRAVPLLDALLARQRMRQQTIVTTDVGTGALALYTSAAEMPEALADAARRGESRMVGAEANAGTFVHVFTPPPRVVVVGATHLGQHLVAMLAMVGYDCVLVDPRTAYANAERFAGVRILTEWPDDAMATIGIDGATAVAAVSHNPDIDDGALKQALAAGCFYVGALGSSRNHARRKERLAAAGVPPHRIELIRAPIGLDIGAHGAAEIAASIVAEIIAAHRRRDRT